MIQVFNSKMHKSSGFQTFGNKSITDMTFEHREIKLKVVDPRTTERNIAKHDPLEIMNSAMFLYRGSIR